jgi:SAM-dependent methyltransferase
MDARLQLRVQRYGWDAAADHYHAGWEAQLRPAHDRLMQVVGIGAGQKVIETACGSGLITLRLAEIVGPDGRVLATDISQGMIDDLKLRLKSLPFSNVDAVRMAAEDLDVPDTSHDVAVAALGLMYTPDPARAVREMARVVKSGGTVAATVWGERRNCGWAEVFPIVDSHVASEVCPMFFGTGAPGTLKALFGAAGLHEVQEHRHSETLVFASDEDVVKAVLLGGPVALAVKRFDHAVWREVVTEFLASIEAFRSRDGGYRIPGEFVTVCGRRSS